MAYFVSPGGRTSQTSVDFASAKAMGHDLQRSTALTVCDVVWVEDRFDIAANIISANRLSVVVHVLFVPF